MYSGPIFISLLTTCILQLNYLVNNNENKVHVNEKSNDDVDEIEKKMKQIIHEVFNIFVAIHLLHIP